MEATARFAALVEAMLATTDATYGSTPDASKPGPTGPQRTFGSTSLKTNGKIFVMLVGDRLVVKLDRRRVDELVAAGTGERFDPGHGRLMREWLAVDPAADDDRWRSLADEAEAFVGGRGKP